MGISLVCGGILMTAQAGKEVDRSLAVNGETLQRYYQNIFRENMLRYRKAVKSASSRKDALRLVAAARERVKNSFNAFPAEKCELNARTLETVDFPEFTLEKVLFESRRNFTVTANFYLPKKGNGKFPAVLFLSGHADKAKADSSYVKIPTMLARKGCAVLAIRENGCSSSVKMFPASVRVIIFSTASCWRSVNPSPTGACGTASGPLIISYRDRKSIRPELVLTATLAVVR